MDDNSSNQPKTAVWAVAFAIVTSIITYWQYEARLVSPRPVFRGIQEASTIGDQKYLARLWQDPLANGGTNVDDITILAKQIRHKRQATNDVEVMGVMVEGFPYPEDVEQRLRIRYAVETALFAQGYKLSDRSHIGLATMSWPVSARILDASPAENDEAVANFAENWMRGFNYCVQMLLKGSREPAVPTGTGARVLIPFEWAEKGNKSLLILWLQEEQFADYPLTRLAKVITRLELAKTLAADYKFKLIGPRSSDTLKGMTDDPAFVGAIDRCREAREYHHKLLNHLQVYSTSATAPDSTFFGESNQTDFGICRDAVAKAFGELPGEEAFKNFIHKSLNYLQVYSTSAMALDAIFFGESKEIYFGISRQPVDEAFTNNLGEDAFKNFILTDDLLAFKMIKELKLREIDFSHSNDAALVLVSESDTSYGRKIPQCFEAAVAVQVAKTNFMTLRTTEAYAEINRLLSREHPSHGPENVKTFSYLRGLDGTLAKQNTESEGTEPKKKEEGQGSRAVRAPDDYERAQGEAQFDYVRRLADDIDKWQEEHFKYEHTLQPRLVIGVLGSDAYDKLVLLEALRGRFKDAIFFATDMDARYLEKQQQEFCRNLLIVSAEELEPWPKGSHTVTPFREGYQTAIFNACSQIAGGTNTWHSPEPHIFEVGLKGVLDLEAPHKGWCNITSWRFIGSIALVVAGLLWTLLLLPKWAKAIYRLPWLLFRRGRGAPPDPLKFEDSYLDKAENEWLCRRFKVNRLKSKWMAGWVVLGIITTFGCWRWFWRDNDEHMGEPFNWFNGVSIWPTELMRIAIMYYGVICLVRAWYIYRRHRLILWQDFFGPDSTIPATFEMDDLTDAPALAEQIHQAADPLSKFLKHHFDRAGKNDLAAANQLAPGDLKKALLRNINRIIFTYEIYDAYRASVNRVSGNVNWLSRLKPQGYRLTQLNRLILQGFYDFKIRKWDAGAPIMPDHPGRGKLTAAWLKQIWRSPLSFLRSVSSTIEAASINLWNSKLDFVDAQKSCLKYFELGRLGPRCIRIFFAVFAYGLFGVGLFLIWGLPIVPGRGPASFWWDGLILFLAVLVFMVVVFYVVDATRLTERFIHHLGDGVTVWPEHVPRKLAVDRNLDPAHLAGYLDVRFVAYHTQEIGRLFYYPFLMLTLLVAARNELFAPWTWPPCLLIIDLTSASLVFLSAFHIRRSAQRVRKQAIEALQEIQGRLSGGEDEEYKWTIPLDDHGTKKPCVASNYAEKIKSMIAELQLIDIGAYAKVLRDDSVTAAMLPAVGAGLLAVIQKLFL